MSKYLTMKFQKVPDWKCAPKHHLDTRSTSIKKTRTFKSRHLRMNSFIYLLYLTQFIYYKYYSLSKSITIKAFKNNMRLSSIFNEKTRPNRSHNEGIMILINLAMFTITRTTEWYKKMKISEEVSMSLFG